MKPDKLLVFIFALVLSAVSFAQEQLVVDDAFIPAMPPSMQNTAAYFTLHNLSQDVVVLTGAHTDIAERVMLHETVNHNGQMHMSHLESLEIPPGERITLESGGMHFMVMGLRSSPAPGEEVSLILEFESGLELPLILPVRSLLPEDADGTGHRQ